ncbi:Profilin [Harpegnathos saltator]|uniref:Profilin n=1 Tax=Harpegnathos saltator TaxID=610380 RepID=E2B8U1_HARSA|nr:Profilin [Harpegnathos saltator]
MSWQDYVDKQLLASRCVTKAAIAGHDGNVWAKSDGFESSRIHCKRLPRDSSHNDSCSNVCLCFKEVNPGLMGCRV